MYLDLHIHTVASDGVYTPSELLKIIKDKEVKYFSTCDHDSIDTSRIMLELVREFNAENNTDLKYVPGIELTSTYMGKEFHILFYSYDIENEIIKKYATLGKEERKRATESFITEIQDEYPGIISIEEYKNYEFEPTRGGFKLINYLMEKEIVDKEEFFSPTWRNRWDRQCFADTEEMLGELKKVDGTIVLAHPSYYFRESGMPVEMLDKFKSFGIDGIECYSPYCKSEFFSYYVDYAKRNGLLVTAGSDSHGSFTKDREVGRPRVSVDDKDIRETIKVIFKE